MATNKPNNDTFAGQPEDQLYYDPRELSSKKGLMLSAVIERESQAFHSTDQEHQTVGTHSHVDYENGTEYSTSHIAWDYTRPGDKVSRDLVNCLFDPHMMANKRTVIVEGIMQDNRDTGRYVRYVELFPAPQLNSKGDIRGYKNGFRIVNFSVSKADGLSVVDIDKGTYKDGDVKFNVLQGILRGGIDTASPAHHDRSKEPSILIPYHIAIGVEGVSPMRQVDNRLLTIFDDYARVLEEIIFEHEKSFGRKIVGSILRRP